MNWIQLIGFGAATLTTASLVPQVVRSHRTRHTKDLSLPTYLVLVSGVFLWLVYGAMIGDKPLLVANGVTLLLSVYILHLKIKYG